MHIIFYGPEGSGKSTQAKLLSEKLKVPALVSGDLVRKYAKEDKGIMGDTCREVFKTGHYVPDSEMFVLWKHRFKEPDVDHGFVIDGFPRNLDQVKFLEEKLDKYQKKEDIVFFLKVSEKESIRRLLKRGRKSPDGSLHDTPEKIKERLKRYKKEEKQVLKFYKKRGLLRVINGKQSIEEIHNDIKQIIKKYE